MPAVHMHTEALAGRGETCRWMSAATGASGDRVLASMKSVLSNIIALAPSSENVEEITGDEFYQHPP